MKSYDLIVVGAGSGNMLFTPELSDLRAAIVEQDRFGGTCLNSGCIPSKMFVVTADAARGFSEAARLGVHGRLDRVDWPAVRDRIFGRIDPLNAKAATRRRASGVDVFQGHATFVAPRELQLDGQLLGAEQIVIATGSRPAVPAIPGLESVSYHTSDTIMRLEELPTSMVIIGGGFIAAELGHVFRSFGTTVSIVERGPVVLPAEDSDVARSFTAQVAGRFDLHLNTAVRQVTPGAIGGIDVTVDGPSGAETINAEVLLVAAGRRPQTDLLGAAAAGLELDRHGHVVTDEFFRTSVPGVWSFGDAANHFQLKHLANAEMRIVAHNLTHPGDLRPLVTRVVPHAVFTDPQIASVGMTEDQAATSGHDYQVGIQHYSATAYGWALEDTTSFVKILADTQSRLVLGAHIMGPNAALLLQPLVQAMMLGQTVDQLAREVIYIHPALSEVVEQALLEL